MTQVTSFVLSYQTQGGHTHYSLLRELLSIAVSFFVQSTSLHRKRHYFTCGTPQQLPIKTYFYWVMLIQKQVDDL